MGGLREALMQNLGLARRISRPFRRRPVQQHWGGGRPAAWRGGKAGGVTRLDAAPPAGRPAGLLQTTPWHLEPPLHPPRSPRCRLPARTVSFAARTFGQCEAACGPIQPANSQCPTRHRSPCRRRVPPTLHLYHQQGPGEKEAAVRALWTGTRVLSGGQYRTGR